MFVNSNNIKKFIESGKNYSILNNSILLKKGCQLSLNFEHLNTKNVQLYILRKNGDGKVIINGTIHSLPFNKTTIINIQSNKILINKHISFIGDLNINIIKLDIDEPPIVIDGSWNEFCQKLTQVKNIIASRDGIFASESSSITHNGLIKKIETYPIDSYKYTNETITFLRTCRIVGINSDEDTSMFEMEPLTNLHLQFAENKNKFDDNVNITNAINYGNTIAVQDGGYFEYPLNNIDANSIYRIQLLCESQLNNKHIDVSIVSNNNVIHLSTLNVQTAKKYQSFKFNSKDYNNLILKVLNKKDIARSQVYIHNISCIKELNTQEKLKDIKSTNHFKLSNYNDESINNNINILYKKYSVLDLNTENKDKYELSGTIEFNDFETKLWYYRMARFFTNLNYKAKSKVFHNKNPEQLANLSVLSIDEQSNSLKVLYNTFLKTNTPTSIGQHDVIYTSSLDDMFKLKQLNRSANVQLSYLPWMYIEEKYKRKDYTIYFEHNEQITKDLLNSWPKDKELIIVGTNVNTEFKTISKYTDYKDLIKFIAESSSIIYLDYNLHHISGLLELAKMLNINIITNNKNYINNGCILPTYDNIIDFSFLKFEDKKELTVDSDYNNSCVSILKGLVC